MLNYKGFKTQCIIPDPIRDCSAKMEVLQFESCSSRKKWQESIYASVRHLLIKIDFKFGFPGAFWNCAELRSIEMNHEGNFGL